MDLNLDETSLTKKEINFLCIFLAYDYVLPSGAEVVFRAIEKLHAYRAEMELKEFEKKLWS